MLSAVTSAGMKLTWFSASAPRPYLIMNASRRSVMSKFAPSPFTAGVTRAGRNTRVVSPLARASSTTCSAVHLDWL